MAAPARELDNTFDDPRRRAPLVLGSNDFTTVTETVCGVVERPKPPRAWYVAFAISLTLTGMLVAMLAYLIITGVGVWGNNQPVVVGVRHHQLRVLGRHRPRRHADLGDPLPVPPEVAHGASTASPRR